MRLVCGVGVNDAGYTVCTAASGKQVRCKSYSAWKSMLERCYSDKLHERCPTYIGVTVCEDWKSFMAFRGWWLERHVDGWQLDKDLLGDGVVYSPDSCIYVPQWLNKFTTDSGSARGSLPIGVCYHRSTGKYKAQCNHPFGKIEYLGLFSDPDQAHNAWLGRKLEIAAELKPRMDEIDERIYQRVVEIIKNAK